MTGWRFAKLISLTRGGANSWGSLGSVSTPGKYKIIKYVYHEPLELGYTSTSMLEFVNASGAVKVSLKGQLKLIFKCSSPPILSIIFLSIDIFFNNCYIWQSMCILDKTIFTYNIILLK